MEDEGPAVWGIAGANRDPGGAFTPTPRYRREWKAPPLDVVSDKTAEDLASILSDRGCEIDGVSGALVEGRGAEAPAP